VIATLAGTDAGLHKKLVAFRARQTQAARDMKVPPEA
jgi:5-(carboxyamino)imidazole ribonucleotide mutase